MKYIYSIGDLVKNLNMNKETIRYYEKIGLLSEPKRGNNGYRMYSKEDIDKIRFILIVKSFGFSLKEISRLMHEEILYGDMENVKKVIENKLNDINSKINELEATKKLLEKVKDNVLSQNIQCCNDIEIYLENKS